MSAPSLAECIFCSVAYEVGTEHACEARELARLRALGLDVESDDFLSPGPAPSEVSKTTPARIDTSGVRSLMEAVPSDDTGPDAGRDERSTPRTAPGNLCGVAQSAERPAVNREVAGSMPAAAASSLPSIPASPEPRVEGERRNPRGEVLP